MVYIIYVLGYIIMGEAQRQTAEGVVDSFEMR